MGLVQPKCELRNPNDVPNGPSKTKARVAQVQGEPLARLQFIGGLQDLHNMNHLRDVHRAFALPTRYGKWCSLSFFFSLFFFDFCFLLTHFVPTYEILYQLAHTTVARKLHGTMCKAQAIINELASIGKVITSGGWLTKECKWEKSRGCVIP